MKRVLILDAHDEKLAEEARKAIDDAIAKAHNPVAVCKRIVSRAVYHRNKGRVSAMERYPFQGICEVSGLRIDKSIASLDELEPEKGYDGKLRWICQKANNDGSGSCGTC